MANFINLTPHKVIVCLSDGSQKVFEPSGSVARVNQEMISLGAIDGIPVSASKFSNVVGVPDPVQDTYYIVSALVLNAVKRDDLVSPDTSPSGAVRDANGQIIGVKGFLMNK